MPTKLPPRPPVVTWTTLSGKPTAFTPSAHTHPWAEITGTPASYPPSAHTHGWTDIAGKPATYPPSAHTHLWADITDRPTIPAATPLATTAARALGTAAVGTSTNAAREDHVHPLPAGLQQYIGDAIINRTLLLALGSGMQREYVALAGVLPTDNLTYTCIGACSAGCAPMNVYADTNRVLLEYNTPALGIGAVINPRVRVYRIT